MDVISVFNLRTELVQAVLPQVTLERLHERIIGGFIRLAELQLDLVFVRPCVQRLELS